MTAGAILLAAGTGERMGVQKPKAFIHVGNRTLLEWSVAAVEACEDIESFVVTVPAGHEEAGRRLAASAKLETVVAGGDTRQRSVRLGLQALSDRSDVVVCHDVARPLAPPELFSSVVAALEEAYGAIPVVPVTDTVKRVKGHEVQETVSRDELAAAQTPQAFRRAALEEAHDRASAFDATDDAALLEAAGFRVVAVPGDPGNIKITRMPDLMVAEALVDA